MKEAYGGILNLVFIIVFLTIIVGVLGFVFAYTKAFKFKNTIIDTIERYEASGCYPEMSGGGSSDSVCRKRIWEVATGDLAYNPPTYLRCPSGYTQAIGPGGKPFYCYKMTKHRRSGNNYMVFRVIVQVDIQFPIIDRIAGMNIFQVDGDTQEILVR